ncbi:acyl-[acyl-carrier-protein] thioesterase [candidate division KSB1 bacterium]
MKKNEQSFAVETYQTQATGEIHIHTLMQYLQESASEHAHKLGWGYDNLKEMNCYWVLVNFKIMLKRLPKWREKFTVQTWPSGRDRLKACRVFLGLDSEGKELFTAGSDWMILDAGDNRPKNLNEVALNFSVKGDRLIKNLKRLRPREKYKKMDCIKIPYSAVDINGHVNNTEYIRWGTDILKTCRREMGKIRSVHISFLSEIFENEEMELLVHEDETAETFSVLGKRKNDEKNIFLLEFGF